MAKTPRDERAPQKPGRRDDGPSPFRRDHGRAQEGEQQQPRDRRPIEVDRTKPDEPSGE